MKNKKTVIFLTILNIGAIFCLILAYGPWSGFRNWFITTSCDSWTHSYLARILYSEDRINGLLSSYETIINYEPVNTEMITFNNEDPLVYDSIYEEQILKRDEGNDLYKTFEVDLDTDKAYVLVIYDPSRISLVTAPTLKNGNGMELDDIVKYYDAIAGINASGFDRSSGAMKIVETYIIGGQIYKDLGGGIIGFNNDNVLILTNESASEAVAHGLRDGVSFGPFLIVNGVPSKFSNGGGYGLRARTAVGQRKDGTVIFVGVHGNTVGTSGADMEELTELFVRYGCYNAANLDGGGSSAMYVNGRFMFDSCGWGECYQDGRYLPNAWIIK